MQNGLAVESLTYTDNVKLSKLKREMMTEHAVNTLTYDNYDGFLLDGGSRASSSSLSLTISISHIQLSTNIDLHVISDKNSVKEQYHEIGFWN